MERDRSLVVAIVVVWCAVFTAAFYPAESSVDTYRQYDEGMAWSFTTMHAPLHSALLGASGHLFGGTGPLLVLQLLLWGGLCGALTLRALEQRRRRRWLPWLLFAAMLLLPPAWSIVPSLWKDVWTALGLLIVGVGFCKSGRARVVVVVVGALVLGASRYNAVLIGLPLALWAAWSGFGRWRHVVVVGVVVVALPPLLTRLLPVRDTWPLGPTTVFDTVGLVVAHPEELASTSLAPIGDLGVWRRAWRPTQGWRIFGRKGVKGVQVDELGALRAPLTADWRRLVRRHPGTWLEHRATVFSAQLGIPRAPGAAWAPSNQSKTFPRPDFTGRGYVALAGLRELTNNETPLFRPWPWLLLLCGLVVVGARARCVEVVVCGVAVVGYLCAYFFVAASAEYRYAQPVVVACFVCAIWLLRPGVKHHGRQDV